MMQGARRIAELLQQRGVRLAMVLDEGGVIADGLLRGANVYDTECKARTSDNVLMFVPADA